MKPVTIYTKSWCPYCAAAKELLTARARPFRGRDQRQGRLAARDGLPLRPQHGAADLRRRPACRRLRRPLRARQPRRARPAAGGLTFPMIRFALNCGRGHAFESWFRDNASWEKQAKAGLVECPHCGSTQVEKAIMAPRVARTDRGGEPAANLPANADARAGGGPHRDGRAAARGARHARHAPRPAPPCRGDRRQCRPALRRRGAQDALRRDRAPRDLRLGHPEEARELREEGVEAHPLPIIPDDRN